jgi:membrane-associated phospholipid phosphatase
MQRLATGSSRLSVFQPGALNLGFVRSSSLRFASLAICLLFLAQAAAGSVVPLPVRFDLKLDAHSDGSFHLFPDGLAAGLGGEAGWGGTAGAPAIELAGLAPRSARTAPYGLQTTDPQGGIAGGGLSTGDPHYPWDDSVSGLAPLRLRVVGDLRDLVTSPARMERRHWRLLGGAALAVGAVSLLDNQIREQVYTGSSGSEKLARTVRPLGQEGGLAVLGVSWWLGKTLHRPKLTAVATDGLEAVILSAAIVTPALKKLSGRSRPRELEGSHSFGGGESFPSGEVTEAFAIASVIAAHAERRWVRGLAWSLAGLVAWERMALDAHWASDVTLGAIVGSALGRWVVHRNRPELADRRRVSWAPSLAKGSYGLNVRWELGRRP